MKVLVIDDDLDIRRLAHYALSNSGMNVVLAETGIEGIEKAHTEYPDAILLDLQMPDVDGATALEALLRDPETASIPVVLLTGSDRFTEIVRMDEVRGVITKPFSLSTFAEEVQALILGAGTTLPSLGDGDEIRAAFIAGLPARFESIERAIEVVEAFPRDDRAMTELLRGFHQLAGTAGSCGFPVLGEIAQRGEVDVDLFMREEIVPDSDATSRWRHLLAQLHQAARGATAPTEQEAQKRVGVVSSDGVLVSELSRCGDGSLTFFRAEEPLSAACEAILIDARDREGAQALVETGEAIRKRGTPLVVISDSSSMQATLASVRAGAAAHFAEPLEREAIVERLSLLIEGSRESRRVLLISEDSDLPGVIGDVVESAGYVFDIAAPADIERSLLSFRPDLLLVDESCSTIAPDEIVKFIRISGAWPVVPLIALASDPASARAIRTIDAGCDLIVGVPPDRRLLLAALSSRLARTAYLRSLARLDPLTGALTHTAFVERLTGEISERRRSPARPVLLLLVDIDGFAELNSNFGPSAGDEVLKSFGHFLKKRLRPSDVIGRYGADEFGVLLTGVEIREGAKLATRILREFSSMAHNLRDKALRVTFSGAASEQPEGSVRASEWIHCVSTALAYAKREGGNRVVAAHSEDEFETFFAEEESGVKAGTGFGE